MVDTGHSQVTTCLITEWDVNVKLMKWNIGRLINDVIVAISHTDHGLITNYMMYLTIDGAYHEPSRLYYQLPIMSIFSQKKKKLPIMSKVSQKCDKSLCNCFLNIERHQMDGYEYCSNPFFFVFYFCCSNTSKSRHRNKRGKTSGQG